MLLRRIVCLTSVLLFSLASRADSFIFQLTGPSDAAQGVLTATSTGTAGSYTVSGISGTMNGLTITSLIDPGVYPPDAPNDNAFFYPATAGTTYFDDCGISFELSDGTDVNLYYGTYSSAAGELGPGYILVEGVDETASAVTTLSFSPLGAGATVTPEPSTLALLSSGVAALCGLGRRRIRSGWMGRAVARRVSRG